MELINDIQNLIDKAEGGDENLNNKKNEKKTHNLDKLSH
jgi:hypothetical protein